MKPELLQEYITDMKEIKKLRAFFQNILVNKLERFHGNSFLRWCLVMRTEPKIYKLKNS